MNLQFKVIRISWITVERAVAWARRTDQTLGIEISLIKSLAESQMNPEPFLILHEFRPRKTTFACNTKFQTRLPTCFLAETRGEAELRSCLIGDAGFLLKFLAWVIGSAEWLRIIVDQQLLSSSRKKAFVKCSWYNSILIFCLLILINCGEYY